MTNKNIPVSFNTFYLIEFFDKTIQKSKDVISSDNYEKMKKLSEFLISSDDLISGLEKLAQYQGTNEFAIFLFDMFDHIGDYSPLIVYDTLPDLVEDFVNLYSLMIEDQESIEAVDKVLVLFKDSIPQKEQAISEIEEIETIETPADIIEDKEVEKPVNIEETSIKEIEPLLSLKDFYFTDAKITLTKKLKDIKAEKRTNYQEMIDIFCDFNKNSTKDEINTYDKKMQEIVKQVNILFPKQFKKNLALDIVEHVEENAKSLLSTLKSYEKEEPDHFYLILEKNSVIKSLTSETDTENVPIKSEPESIDNLLAEYFNTEVDDHIQQIRKLIDDINKIDDSKKQIKLLKEIQEQLYALKELSMIHGYSGYEHITASFASKLDTVLNEDIHFNSEFIDNINVVLQSLAKTDTFLNTDSKSDVYASFKDLCDKAIISLKTKPVEEKQIEKDETLKETDDLISFDDSEKIYSIIKEVLLKSYDTVKEYHANLKNENVQKSLFVLLETLEASLKPLNESLSTDFWQPLTQLYNRILESDFSNFDVVNGIWDKLINSFAYPLDKESIVSLFNKEEIDLLSFDHAVLANTYKKYWFSLNAYFPEKYLQDDQEAKVEINLFFDLLLKNLASFKIDNYIKPVERIKGFLTDSANLNSDFINEINRSFIMILERFELNGPDSDCSDILEILEEVITVENQKEVDESTEKDKEPLIEDSIKEEKEPKIEPEEEDVEKIFIDESIQNIDNAQKTLDIFKKDGVRKNLTNIENEIHTIKSSASLLNKQKIVDITNSIEDVVELFGQSSIPFPDNLTTILDRGLSVLKELLNDDSAEIEEDVEALDSLLDQVIIDETAGAETVEEVSGDVKMAQNESAQISENVDSDLLEIFKQESEAYISTLEDTINALQINPDDKKAVDEFESSIHSLKSAAKMLGFKEIGQLSDNIESVIEGFKSEEIPVTNGVCFVLNNAIGSVKKLSLGEGVNASDLTNINATLENKEFPEIEIESDSEEEEDETLQGRDRFKGVFLEEANDLIESLNADSLKLEKKPDSSEILNEILRNLHTLKGSSLMSGFEKIGELSHKLEDYLDVYSTKSAKQKGKMLDPLFDVLDIIQDMLNSLAKENGTEAIPHLMTRLAAIDNRLFQFQDKSFSEEQVKETITAVAKPIHVSSSDGENVVKVSTSYLDALVNMSTELVINRTELSSHIEKLKGLVDDADLSKRQIRKIENKIDELFDLDEEKIQDKMGEEINKHRNEFSESLHDFTGKVTGIINGLNKLSEELDRDVTRIDSVSKVLHHDILKARMVPISTLFGRYPKAVRDLARKQGKKISLKIDDNNAELDRAMVAALSDPILHILRNAVDHGIETPDERIEFNKSQEANIAIIARQEKSQVIIDIIDDGKGIDIEKTKEIIQKNELATADEISKMSEAEILDYIFSPGFTTKDSISNVSGRGIGLDVVASQIQKLKGNIRIRTENNIGTTFSLRVPLTLTISQALLIRSQGQTLALPIFAIKETIEATEDSLVSEDGKNFIKVRGALLPFVRLDELLKFDQNNKEIEKVNKVLVLSDAGINIALGVEEVVNRQEIVIKTLGSLLQNIDYISGGTILGNGEVCLILDYALIVRTVELHTIGGETDIYALKSERKTIKKSTKKKASSKKKSLEIKLKKISGRKPRIMIVDDSRSVLNFVSAILDDNKMEPVKSSSGIEALEQIEENDIDLLITDLEMPKMHGFELVKSIRKNKKFDQLPIIILTGRDTKADREKAQEYGANAFINKPFKERDLLKVMEQFIQAVK